MRRRDRCTARLAPGVDFGDHLAFGAVDLGPDVVAVGRAPAVLDHAERAVRETKRDDAIVDVVELGQLRLDQDRPGRADVSDLLAGQEPGGVDRGRRGRGRGRRWCAGS